MGSVEDQKQEIVVTPFINIKLIIIVL